MCNTARVHNIITLRDISSPYKDIASSIVTGNCSACSIMNALAACRKGSDAVGSGTSV